MVRRGMKNESQLLFKELTHNQRHKLEDDPDTQEINDVFEEITRFLENP